MTHDEIQQIALMRMEICDLQRQNTLLQRCLAQVSSDQVAMLELLRIACSKKNTKRPLDTRRNPV
jgi:hypothetical protein